jgi:hypothetical protein
MRRHRPALPRAGRCRRITSVVLERLDQVMVLSEHRALIRVSPDEIHQSWHQMAPRSRARPGIGFENFAITSTGSAVATSFSLPGDKRHRRVPLRASADRA